MVQLKGTKGRLIHHRPNVQIAMSHAFTLETRCLACYKILSGFCFFGLPPFLPFSRAASALAVDFALPPLEPMRERYLEMAEFISPANVLPAIPF
jgi:hypothetical protein